MGAGTPFRGDVKGGWWCAVQGGADLEIGNAMLGEMGFLGKKGGIVGRGGEAVVAMGNGVVRGGGKGVGWRWEVS